MFQSTTSQRRRRLALWANGIPGSPLLLQSTPSACQSQTTRPLGGAFMQMPTYRPARSIRGSFRFAFVYVFRVAVPGS